jgi:hypothetical protein
MPPTSAAVAPRKPEARSRVTNGGDVLPGVDGRSLVARRYRDIFAAVAVDQGGSEHLSETRLQLIRRFAAAAVLAEQMEAKLANGGVIDLQEHALVCSTLVRIAQRIGVDQRARNVVPSLADYLEARAEHIADEAAG